MKSVIVILLLSMAMVGCDDGSGSTSDTPQVEQPPIEYPPTPVEPPVEEPKTATLSWTAPTTRVNGTSFELYEIEHYTITHYSGDTVETVNVSYDLTEYTFNDLPIGMHEFDIVTVDIDGLVSARSETVSKVIK